MLERQKLLLQRNEGAQFSHLVSNTCTPYRYASLRNALAPAGYLRAGGAVLVE